MRTTVTLEPDVEQLVKELMRDQHMGFKAAINKAIRLGLARDGGEKAFRTPTFSMGVDPGVDYTKALALAAQLEDEELVGKLSARR